ncbi:MAG TPA: glycosyltransferase family 4 protein [Bryobacteraceae bacterium]|nr:glycosyltransferase family 4 protein [Bryobacteraceae bacterium]
MHIVLLNQFFWPDSAPTSEYAADLAEQLVAEGHAVTVICSASFYGGESSRPEPAVDVWRIPTPSFSRRGAGRLASYLFFFLGSLLSLAWIGKADCVVTMTTPPFLGCVGWILRRLTGARHIQWEMDCYPEVLKGSGSLSETHYLFRVLAGLARSLRNGTDRVVVLGPCMRDRLIRSGVRPEKIVIVENWADPEIIRVLEWPTGDLIVKYSGNLGKAHDSETVSAILCSDRLQGSVRFTFAVSTEQRKSLERVFQGSSNVQFEALRPRHELSAALGSSHIGLVTQSAEYLGALVPSKFYGLLAAGRPVLFIGPEGATPGRWIEQTGCGWHIHNGDSGALTELLNHLSRHPSVVAEAGRRARALFEERFTKSKGLERLARVVCADRQASTLSLSHRLVED